MTARNALADYPSLLRWYHEQTRGGRDRAAIPETLVYDTCTALQGAANGGKPDVAGWMRDVRGFLGRTKGALQDFLTAEVICQRCDAELLDIVGEFAEIAVRSDMGSDFFRTMENAADATNLVALRFLSAWSALNAGELESCIEQCEKVDEPFAAVYTIQGQAMLDLARADEAAEVLSIAVKLAPAELLAWFQLAKAEHVRGQAQASWKALTECRRLAPQSDEVALFAGLVALEPAVPDDMAATAWSQLRPCLARHAGNATIVATLGRLACKAGEKTKMVGLVADTDWAAFMRSAGAASELAPLLRALQGRGWMDVASSLLGKVTDSPAA